jgi:IclR family acetate operon transcriptional repressor
MAEFQELKAPPLDSTNGGAPIHKETALKTVLGALDVLEFLGTQEGFVRLTDISASLGLAKGKVHRLLRTLLSRNYVIQDPATRGYSLGLSAWVLGREAREIRSLVDAVQPQMEELCSLSEETVILSVLEGFSQITLYTKRGPHLVHVFVREGALAPLHATATGKAILALLDEGYLEQLAARGLPRYTERTITTVPGLVREIRAARKRGYASAIDEWAADLSAVSTGLREQARGTYLSLGIAFPTSRATSARMRQLGELVKEKAGEAQRFLEG